MPDAVSLHAVIPQLAPYAFEQVIIAGGDDDVSAADLLGWVAPLLAGIPGGRWMSCEIDAGSDGLITVSYRDGSSERMTSAKLDPASPAATELLGLLPEAHSVAVILLSDFSSQAITLLDSIARWLSIHDTDEGSLAPVLRLLCSFQSGPAEARAAGGAAP